MTGQHPQSPLSDAEVEQVSRLIESLDRSGFDYLQVSVGAMTITIGTGEPPGQQAPPPAPAAGAAPVRATPAVVPEPTVEPASELTDGLLEITAPTMGIFYSRPEPGKPPFVAVGDPVEESTTVALVEVMKTFHAVPAGVRGTVREICVKDTDFVEFGQVLMRVEPVGAG